MMRNTILALDEFYYHRPLYCLSTNTACSCWVLYLEFPAIQQLFFFTRNITISYVINVVRKLHHLLRICDTVMLLAITILFLVPVLSELCCANLLSLATLLLQS